MACSDDCGGRIPHESPRLLGNPHVLASLGAWALVAFSFLAHWLKTPHWLSEGALAGAILSGGFYFAHEAVEKLKEKIVGIELLMTVAILGAVGLGRWHEAALVAALYSISEALEGFTIQRTRYAIRGLMDRIPPKARLLKDGQEVEVDVKEVKPGERIQIRPGEAIPVDGLIREGASTVDESSVTGESMPAERGVGQPVFAGTLNGGGLLVVEATKALEDNTVSRIIDLVEKAQAQKGRSQLWVERFGRVYSPAVLGMAVLVGGIPPLLGGEAGVWLRRAVSALVAASPCALAVATPVTLVAAIGSAARRGVLIKGGNVLELLGKVQVVALDKTGTITAGKPAVTDIHAFEDGETEVLRLAASVERYSEHPLAKAIVAAAGERGLALRPTTGFTEITGSGASAMVDGKTVRVLRPSASVERGILLSDSSGWLESAQERGQSIVVVAVESKAVGLIALADRVRPEASALVSSLKKVGVRHVVMLTGDNSGTAKAIAAQVGIEEFYGGLLPEDKVSRIRELQSKYGGVAMVGDGINDAPALATASVGIAMGVAGSDTALAAADVALMADDLSKLGYAVTLGRRSSRLIAQNIAASLVIVAGLLVGVFAADLTMFLAVLGHEGSEVLIILNGLRAAL